MRKTASSLALLIITTLLIVVAEMVAQNIPNFSELQPLLPKPPVTTAPPVAVESDQAERHYAPTPATKFSGCQVITSRPEAACTPGGVMPNATTEQICTPGYASRMRNVSSTLKRQVYLEYSITDRGPNMYQVDHLISLQLGGSNELANLWPQPINDTVGAHQKDVVEDYLHDELCDGRKSLEEVQRLIASDWPGVYQSINKQ